MWKPLTGEPYAGKPHVRFGGRGGAEPSLPLSVRPCESPCQVQLVVPRNKLIGWSGLNEHDFFQCGRHIAADRK